MRGSTLVLYMIITIICVYLDRPLTAWHIDGFNTRCCSNCKYVFFGLNFRRMMFEVANSERTLLRHSV